MIWVDISYGKHLLTTSWKLIGSSVNSTLPAEIWWWQVLKIPNGFWGVKCCSLSLHRYISTAPCQLWGTCPFSHLQRRRDKLLFHSVEGGYVIFTLPGARASCDFFCHHENSQPLSHINMEHSLTVSFTGCNVSSAAWRIHVLLIDVILTRPVTSAPICLRNISVMTTWSPRMCWDGRNSVLLWDK